MPEANGLDILFGLVALAVFCGILITGWLLMGGNDD